MSAYSDMTDKIEADERWLEAMVPLMRRLKIKAFQTVILEDTAGFEVRYGDQPQQVTLIMDGTLGSEIVFTVDKVLASFLAEKMMEFVNPGTSGSLRTQNSILRDSERALREELDELKMVLRGSIL